MPCRLVSTLPVQFAGHRQKCRRQVLLQCMICQTFLPVLFFAGEWLWACKFSLLFPVSGTSRQHPVHDFRRWHKSPHFLILQPKDVRFCCRHLSVYKNEPPEDLPFSGKLRHQILLKDSGFSGVVCVIPLHSD